VKVERRKEKCPLEKREGGMRGRQQKKKKRLAIFTVKFEWGLRGTRGQIETRVKGRIQGRTQLATPMER